MSIISLLTHNAACNHTMSPGKYAAKGPGLWRPECSEGTAGGPRPSTVRIYHWTRRISGLDYSGSTIGQIEFANSHR